MKRMALPGRAVRIWFHLLKGDCGHADDEYDKQGALSLHSAEFE